MKNSRNKKAITSGLISAVREGNLEKARELINSFGLSHSKAWSGGYVLLRDALKNKNAAVAKLLLTSGSKVNIKSQKPTDTPLHFAVMNDDIEIVKMILDNDADFDAENQYGQTPLHVAAEKGYLKIAEHLLDNGANVSCVCTWTQSWRQNYAPLHCAVERGHTEVVTLLLSRGADVDAEGEDSITPLHIAAKNGYTDRYIRIAEDLLNHGASIHSLTLKEGYTPLHFASEQYNDKAVKLLLNRGAGIHARTKDDSTPLHTATKRGCERVVKCLLKHGAKVDHRDKDDKTILFIAVEKPNLTIIGDILNYCPDINDRSNRSSLKIAVFRSGRAYEKIVKALLEYGLIVNPEDTNNSMLLHAAVEKGYLKIIEHLLKYGADVNTLYHSTFREGFTLLQSAAENKQEEVAKLLISYKADVNAQDKTGKTPIFYAVENVDLRIIKLLLTNRADIKGRSELLNIAVEEECIEIIEVLLQHDADINASDGNGRTALHFIAPSNSRRTYICQKNPDINIKQKIAKLLLSNGANVNAQTKDGVTILHAAVENGYVEVVEALLEYNPNVNCKDQSDYTPLHHSARKGYKDISKMLLNEGADMNAKQKYGMTPLHLAAQKKHLEVVEVLLEHGSEVDSRMTYDLTPLHLAAHKECPEIIETMLKFGADIHSRDEHGRIALHIASECRNRDVVATLLDYGSDINITSKNNCTALGHAIGVIGLSYDRVDDSDFNNYESDDDFPTPYRSDSHICSPEVIADALIRHIIKLRTANLFVSKKLSRAMNHRYEMSAFQDECQVELERMKNKKISNSNFSFYDILAKDTSSLAICMRNEDIAQILELYDYERAFPIYAGMIKNYFREGIKKYELLEQGYKSFHFLSKGLPELPYDCTEKIISSLSDEDLRNLIDAC